MLAVVSVLGPALPITIVKLVVPPTAIVVLAAVLVRLGVTCTVAVPGAVAVLEPRFVTPPSGLSVTVFVYPPALVACTTTVTVTVPPVGRVTLPPTLVPFRLNAVGTLAPPPVWLLTWVAVRFVGRLSTMLAVVSVLGPALPITIVKLVVPPTAIVVLAAVLVRLGVTTIVLAIVLVSVLLPVAGSGVVDVMLTRLVMDPLMPLTSTVNVMVPPAPAVRLTAVAVTLAVLVLRVNDPLTAALTKVNPAALRLSVKVTLAAALGPAFA
jgi:hypothetical protein